MTRRFRPYAIRAEQRRSEAAEAFDYYNVLDPAIPGDVGDGTAKPAECANCHQPCTTDDYCEGCDRVVCERCDNPNSSLRPSGPHSLAHHLPRPKVLS